jgi:hypothetical protein
VNWSSGPDFTPRLDNHSAKLGKNAHFPSVEQKKVAPICSNFAPLGLEKRGWSRKFVSTHLFDFI